MRATAALCFSAALAATGVVAHGQAPPARPAVDSTGQRYVAIGCLSRQGTAASPRYVITDTRGGSPINYRLDGDAAELARHVGHTVEVSGPLAQPRAGATGTRVLKVSSLVWVASSCHRDRDSDR
jgi:hypothetical protein